MGINKTKVISFLLITAMVVVSLIGCSGAPGSTPSSTSQSSTTPPAASSSQPAPVSQEPAKDVTLRFSWWGSDPRHEATLAAIEKYRELYPNVTIEGEYQGYDGYQQKLMTQIAGGTQPDLMQLDYVWYPDLAARSDAFVDLGKDSNIDLTPYPQAVLDNYCSFGDKIYALPMGTNGFGTMINKAFFDKHGLSVDTVWTWEKIIEEGGRINAANPSDHLFAIESGTSTGGVGPFIMSAYIYNKTGKYWANEETNTIQASKDDLVAAFTVIKNLFDSGAAQPLGEASLFTGQMEQNPKWLNAEMGFTVDWSSTVGKYKSAVGEENIAVGKPPFVEGAANQSISFKPSMVLGVSSKSSNIDDATRFTNWFLNDSDAARILGTQRSVPTNQNAFDVLQSDASIDSHVAAIVEFTLESPAPPVPIIHSNNEVADIVKDICEQVVFGVLTPEGAADKFLTDVAAKMGTL